jgi:hypothetical protein
MGAKIYLETSVVSYFASRPSRDVVTAGRQQTTHDFWALLGKEFEGSVSSLVLMEAERGDADLAKRRLKALESFPVIQTTPEADELANAIVEGRGIPREFPEDALHIDLATMGGMDFLVTWNFAHINNPFTRMMIRQLVENAGYISPEIVSPDELLGEES